MKSETLSTRWGDVVVRGMNGLDYEWFAFQNSVRPYPWDVIVAGLLSRCVSGPDGKPSPIPDLSKATPAEAHGITPVVDKVYELTEFPEADPGN